MKRKVLELTITLGSGDFGEDVGDTVTLSKTRMTADISNPGGESMGMCQLRVYGLEQSLMNKLTTIGQVNVAIRAKNSILLAAGEEGETLSTAFQGTILDAWADYNSAPDVAFNIIAYAGLDVAVKPVQATSYKGATSVTDIIYDIAKEMELALEYYGDDVSISNPYLAGTSLAKLRAITRAAGLLWSIERGTLAVWNRNSGRGTEIPLISPETGMVGYPSLSSKGMTVRMLFNQNIRIGGDIQAQSAIPMACGTWRVFNETHNLSCEMPDGPWFTTVEAYIAGQ